MTTEGGRPVVGTCHCCQTPVRQGEERREAIEHGTAAAPEVLLHRQLCVSVNRRSSTPEEKSMPTPDDGQQAEPDDDQFLADMAALGAAALADDEGTVDAIADKYKQ